MKKEELTNLTLTDTVIRQVLINLSHLIHRKLYCGDICIKQEDLKYTVYIKSIYGVKFIKLIVDIDPNSWYLRFRIYHDWCLNALESVDPEKEGKPLKTILINDLKDFEKRGEIKYIIDYFSEASRNNYKYFRDNLSTLHKGKKSFWNYIKFWFKWPKKRPI